ncbi:MAG: apolipoprotein N-acyltransferase [bacterium]
MKTSSQILCALLSGVLVCFSFPTVLFGWHAPEMGWLAWVALVPLIAAVRGATPRKAFSLTFLSAIVWYGSSLYWVFRAMHTFGGLSSLTSALVLVLLTVIVAAYVALAPMAARLVTLRWRGEFVAWLAVFWTAAEFCRNYFPCNGFPWANIAMSQWRNLHLIQIADLIGIYGIIFLIVWTNACIVEIIVRIRGERVRMLAAKIGITAVLIGATVGYGAFRIDEIKAQFAGAPIFKIGMVQGNIAQEMKWAENRLVENVGIMRQGTRQLRDAAVDLIAWPESAFPWAISTEATEIDPRALGMDKDELGKFPYLLIGALSERPDGEYYNSALLFDAKGKIEGRYHKAHLVPFGEYVPYKKLFFFARKLTRPAGNFIAGESYEPLKAGSARLGPLVCYEDVFPEIARKLVKNGAQLLANVTNDAWYGVSSAPYQHLAHSVFRAVENRRFLLRATNTGVSAIIAPTGKASMESAIFTRALIVAPVVLLNELTPYTRLGDWFAWACIAYSLAGIAMVTFARYRKGRGQ